MKIVVALASSSDQLSGVPRHAINLAYSLLRRQEVSVVDLIVAPWQRGLVRASLPLTDARLNIHTPMIRNNAFSRNEWYYRELPRCASQLKADLVHLAYPVPLSRIRYDCPVVVTLHDLYPYDIPENFGFPKVAFNRAVLRGCMSQVDAIACVSLETKSRLSARWHGQFDQKASVIPNVVEQLSRETASSFPGEGPGIALAELEGRPFLLCVAQHRKNKNILLVLQTFCRLLRSRSLNSQTRLVIVGIPGPETKAILRFVEKTHMGSNVLLVNGISEEHLYWCYRNCLVLLAPSKIEGFGLPVAEAMRIGCRIVCSDIGAFRELYSPHCRYVRLGPDAIESLSAAVIDALKEEVPSPIDLPELSPSFIADRYLQLYRSLLTSRDRTRKSTETLSLGSKGRTRYI